MEDLAPSDAVSGRRLGRSARITRRQLVVTVAVASLVVLALWDTVLVWPLQLLVTFVHEAMHAVVATVFGRDVLSVTINSHGGGLTYTRGTPSTGVALLVSSAGYVGAAVLGGVLLEVCSRLRTARVALATLAAGVAGVLVAWVPLRIDPSGPVAQATGSSSGDGVFTIVFALGAVAALVALAVQPLIWLRRGVLVVVATALCLGAVEDLRGVLASSRRGSASDAVAAAAISPLPAWAWATLWLLIGVLACVAGAWSAFASWERSDDASATAQP